MVSELQRAGFLDVLIYSSFCISFQVGECLSRLDGLICRDWCRSSDHFSSPAVSFGAAGLLVRAFSDYFGLANRPL